MAQCEQEHHEGGREVARIVTFFRDGKMHEGCRQCIGPMLTDLYPGQKRFVISQGTGKHYYISPAHKRDIKMRRVIPASSPDAKGRLGLVYRNRRGT